ncbi:MAG: DUF2254 domain-containing protein [Geminicoccaceae bacterium]|nr:DUF2254 domain-containing protein [Geminicoccaceae bacterium]
MRYAFIRYLANRISTSLWLLPMLCVCAAFVVAWFAYWIDRSAIGLKISYWLGVHSLDAGSARLILGTIAGSMMTIASLVVSLTLTTLTLASQQLGPRLIEWFMNNRITQTVLGSYIALFIFALLSIGSVEDSEGGFVSHITIVIALSGAVANLILLIIYVHKAATYIQADTVIASSGTQLNRSIESRCDRFRSYGEASSACAPEGEPAVITSTVAGYIQTIDFSALRDLAARHEGVIRLERRAGDFVAGDMPLASVWHVDAGVVDEEVRNSFVFGPKRTATQDIVFALRGLVEIGLRALSPGINDPYTAVACIEYMGNSLLQLMNDPPAPKALPDGEGVARLLLHEPVLADFADTAFDAIRHAGADNPLIMGTLANAQLTLHDLARTTAQRQLWKTHLRRTLEEAERSIVETDARRRIQEKIQTGLRW